MAQYFSQVAISDGYHFNLMQRVAYHFGFNIDEVSCGKTSQSIYITVPRELTAQEQTELQTIFADNPQKAPANTGNTILSIVDVWENRAAFQAQIGLNYRIYYSESVPDSGVFDRIEFHFDKTLTNKELNDVKAAYAALIDLKA